MGLCMNSRMLFSPLMRFRWRLPVASQVRQTANGVLAWSRSRSREPSICSLRYSISPGRPCICARSETGGSGRARPCAFSSNNGFQASILRVHILRCSASSLRSSSSAAPVFLGCEPSARLGLTICQLEPTCWRHVHIRTRSHESLSWRSTAASSASSAGIGPSAARSAFSRRAAEDRKQSPSHGESTRRSGKNGRDEFSALTHSVTPSWARCTRRVSPRHS